MDQQQQQSNAAASVSPESIPPAASSGGSADAEAHLTIDEIIESHVGSFGLSQMLHVLLLSIARIFDSQITLVTVFSDAQPAWRCSGGNSGSPCVAKAGGAGLCSMRPGSWEWVGGRRSTTIAEWDLVCGRKFEAGVPASMFFVGCMIGSVIHGRLADGHLGRKKTVFLACFLTAAASFLTSFSTNLYMYAFLRFLSGFARAGIGICSMVLATEAVGKRWRSQVGQLSFFFFTLGFLALPLVAYITRQSWRTLYRALALPPLLYCFLVVPFLDESPRWLAVKGRKDEAMKVLKRLARRNGKLLPPNLIISSGCSSSTGPDSAQMLEANGNLWKTWWAAKRMIIVMLTGFGIGFMYYGIQLNVENLSFNLYFAVAVNALMEFPAIFFGTVFMTFMDRRILFTSTALLAAVSSLLCIPFTTNSGHSWPQLSMEAISFMAASTTFDILYIYCVELFPTNVRSLAMSMLRQACMVGAAIAPLLIVVGRLNPRLLFIVFGAFGFFSAAVPFWLPETRNAPLYETLEQQRKEENLGSSYNSNPTSNSNP